MAKNPDKIDILAGSRIRIRRQILGMSQTDLARCLGITFQQVQKYEKGMNRVSASRLQVMAGVLQMSVSNFFDETAAPETVKDDLSRFVVTRESVALNVAFLRISDPVVRSRVIALAEAASAM
jgi:transcriptional regulator with XRE-family HTH domain